MDPFECLVDIRHKGYHVIHCGTNTNAKTLEKACHDIFKLVKAGDARGEYNSSGGVARKTLNDSSLLDTREGAPAELTIQLHNEMAYAAKFPKYIAFAMVSRDVKGTGGDTTLCDNIKVVKILKDILLLKMKTLGIIYTRKLEDISNKSQSFFYNSWQEAFGTEDKTEALKKGNAPDNSIVFEDTDSDRYSMTHVTWCPLFQSCHPVFGETLFCSILNRHGSWLDNHSYFGKLPLEQRPYHCRWGDGSEFTESELKQIRLAHEVHTEKVRLVEGDIIVIDNLRIQHGRSPYTGERALGLLLSDMVVRKPQQPYQTFLTWKAKKL